MRRILKNLWRHQEGITGLETAIILIAFVVVASVFAYTVLSAGIFSSERGKEAVHAGLKQARGSLEIVGGVIANATSTHVERVRFTVSNVLGGEPVDFTPPPNNVVVIDYVDARQHVSNLPWTITRVGRNDGDNLLEAGEKFQVEVDLTGLDPKLDPNRRFSLHVKSPTGATLVIERTTPPVLDPYMDLH
jgi:flagellin FlaB